MTETTAMRRRREIEFLARELFRQAQDLVTAVGDLVPAELAAGGGGELVEGPRSGRSPSNSMTRSCASTCCSRSSACRRARSPGTGACSMRRRP